MLYYIYILSCSADIYYIGQSHDPWERLLHHNNDDKNTFTSKHRPWLLAAVYEVGDSRAGALKIERWIKKQKSRNLIEKLIQPDFVLTGILAQLVRVPHVRD